MSNEVSLSRDSNQALGIGRFVKDYLSGALGPGPDTQVLRQTARFHADSVMCGLSALALRTNAPTILRAEALDYADPNGASLLGSGPRVKPEKAIVANCAAVREWDSNGTNFGFAPLRGHTAGEFGHNDFYPVVMAACQVKGLDGNTALLAMVLLDEIRGRLAEVFSLKSYKIDHVVHGAIASAAVYAGLVGGTPEQIESAIGMFVAHYIPWRAIRAGKQLSDSKGSSAAISTEAAVLCAKRAVSGFVGPADIFRNPESLFRQFEPTNGNSPFDLILSHSGMDFAVMSMHFKIGLYEHQSAGGIQGLFDLLSSHPHLAKPNAISKIVVKAYEPAYGIIGDPAKRDPQTRQSADHSMVYILATALRKAVSLGRDLKSSEDYWDEVMLMPQDYGRSALSDPQTRGLMSRIEFEHGGPEYDAKYPEGIPTSLLITDGEGKTFNSGIVMFPAGHALNTGANLGRLLETKYRKLGEIALGDASETRALVDRLNSLGTLSHDELAALYNVRLAERPPID